MSTDLSWRPPYAYVPGQTPRHDAELFDRFSFDRRDISGSQRWRLAIICMREGYFWEAHELFEPIWMVCPDGSPERQLTQGLIQLANAALKQIMQRPGAVRRLKQIARDLLVFEDPDMVILGMGAAMVAQLWLDVLGEPI